MVAAGYSVTPWQLHGAKDFSLQRAQSNSRESYKTGIKVMLQSQNLIWQWSGNLRWRVDIFIAIQSFQDHGYVMVIVYAPLVDGFRHEEVPAHALSFQRLTYIGIYLRVMVLAILEC